MKSHFVLRRWGLPLYGRCWAHEAVTSIFFLTGSCKLTLRNYLSWKTAWSGFKGLLRDFTGAEGKKLTVSALCTDTCHAAFTQTLALTQNPLVTYPHPHVWFPRTTFNSLNWSQLHFVISEVKIAVLHYVRLLFLKQSIIFLEENEEEKQVWREDEEKERVVPLFTAGSADVIGWVRRAVSKIYIGRVLEAN